MSQQYQGLRCIVIDDEQAVREYVVEVVKETGLECTDINSPLNIAPIDVSQYDLMISDIRLGQNVPSGVQFLESLRESGLGIPTLLISGFAFDKKVEECHDPEQPTLFLSKPFSPSDLIEKVNHLISLSGLR